MVFLLLAFLNFLQQKEIAGKRKTKLQLFQARMGHDKSFMKCQVWWCTPVIPEIGKLEREDHKVEARLTGLHSKFQASLGYIVKSFLKEKNLMKGPGSSPSMILLHKCNLYYLQPGEGSKIHFFQI
jgi:hypothetical protein